jgi:hypothetical protein
MAEIEESIQDSVSMSRIISDADLLLSNLLKPMNDEFNKNASSCSITSESAASEENAPDVIENIYKSMSKIIEVLTTDHLILNNQVSKIRSELEFICNTIANIKIETRDLSYKFGEFKKKLKAVSDIQKQIIETRNTLLQTLEINNKIIKKEISDIKNSYNQTQAEMLRAQIKIIAEQEVKAYMMSLRDKSIN